MRVKFLQLFVMVSVCSISALAQSVVEAESTVIITEKTAEVSLTIESKVGLTGTTAELSIIDADGQVQASAWQAIVIAKGKKRCKFSIPLGDLVKKAGDDLAWYRLQYRIGDLTGVASLSELFAEDFELRASMFEHIIPGESMRVRVRALNPFTEKPIKGVSIAVELKMDLITESDDDELKLVGSGKTGSNGFAVVELNIPPNVRTGEDGEIKISGRKNGVLREIQEDIDDQLTRASVILTADKPLYQPGQTFNVRGIFLDSNSTVVADAEIEFTIKDEDGTVLNRQTVTTSAFGITAITWQIPENAKLGTYTVEVDDDKSYDTQLSFKVSRYDLPNFTVTAKPDKSYYLPSDPQARILVNADYLFGKPVTQGHVRVVQESERKWNYSKQRTESIEGKILEGKADSSGKYEAVFDLESTARDLAQSEWKRFEDVSFSAYFTDMSTNRTEQRRFDIRVTKQPIHIYLLRYESEHADLPFTAYVSTFYADGTPAVCNVEITDGNRTLTDVRTNSLGAGKVLLQIPREKRKGSRFAVSVNARDKKGRTGRFEDSFYLSDQEAIRLRTDKAVYKPGDMVDVDIVSSQESGPIYVDVVRNWTPVDTRVVFLRNGKAHIRIPYKETFKGDLVVIAYDDNKASRWSDSMRSLRGIVFPEQSNLTLNAKFSKSQYSPGEEATVKFAILDGSKKPIESVIGLGIFDKAIEERARTDAEFGGYFGRLDRFMGYERSYGRVTLNDLNNLDMSQPVPPEMDLAAEIMLAGGWYYPVIHHSGEREGHAKSFYEASITRQLKPIEPALSKHYTKELGQATDQAAFERILAKDGINFAELRDPWGSKYLVGFAVNKDRDVISIKTAGPDKQPGTNDDYQVWTGGYEYFTTIGQAIDRAFTNHHERTGRYIDDLAALRTEILREGVDITQLKDRWGHEYKIAFKVLGRFRSIKVTSSGPDGRPSAYSSNDFDLWTSRLDYFRADETRINNAIARWADDRSRSFPIDEAAFSGIMRRQGVNMEEVRDGYGRSVYVYGRRERRYSDKVVIQNEKTTITPVTDELSTFSIRSRGENADDPADDFDLMSVSSASVDYARLAGGRSELKTTVFSGAIGAIRGTVVDAAGAVIPNVPITATDEIDQTLKFSTKTNDSGEYLFGNLPAGNYRITAEGVSGFSSYQSENVAVRSQTMTELNIELSVSGAMSVVDVTAAESIDQSSNTTGTNVSTSVKPGMRVGFPYKEQTSTPRLREYFPETLLWQPELITDAKGKAEVNFKMADNITTWKMVAIASTKKGKIGVVEKEITAFQPFFADLDPPKFLTEDDEIYLPTQVRNYTERKQKVNVTMDKADWFSFLGDSSAKLLEVGSGASANAVFGFKAESPVKAGKQRVTAVGQTDSDAIEKAVTVRPNGQEVVQNDSRVFNGSSRIDLRFPENALQNSQTAELKIYPNLFSHVADSVEGLLQRPYGCGEQTISSTYPNLMILKAIKADTPLRSKAAKYLQKGYERLIGYQGDDGGFTYWGRKDSSDIALTAYALRFLNDADDHVEVDENVTRRAKDWLVRQQRPDGSWTKTYSWETLENSSRSKMMTSYIARTLAKLPGQDKTAVTNALAYLKKRSSEIDEPYALALYGLASLDAGDAATASAIASQLEQMAHVEGSGVYWNLETNTPFYGWGTAGRIETTALVLQLLTRVANPTAPQSENISKGLLFLLKNKDRYGVWYSTQTTINVLDSLIILLERDGKPQSHTINVSLNGIALDPIEVAADRIEPVTINLAGKLSPTTNSIEASGPSDQVMMTQTVGIHYIDWRDSLVSNVSTTGSSSMSLGYRCSKLEPAIMEEVTCSVDAERSGFKGYGMLLAEIGTPPGADVSRESLEAALSADWSLSRYDVLPDRIVLYMWSKAGGTHFNFKFRSRYGINAQTPASVLYDYYNPESQVTARPLRFVAH